ncbi:MAG: class I SAM-dependent RNA methyltransferase [Planctomycetota bacterium]
MPAGAIIRVLPLDPDKPRPVRIASARHLTPLTRRELDGLWFDIDADDTTGVDTRATLAECIELCLHLRTASNVLWLLTRARCPSPDALYKNAAAFPWEEVLDHTAFLTITSAVDHPKIDNSLYASRLLKDAICDRLTQKNGVRPDSGPGRTGVVVHLHWVGDKASIWLSVNGRVLSDRGYRKRPHHAPLRESLAAAVLMLAGYDGSAPLLCPMCGSGTLAIEGALVAAGRAPGLLRPDFGVLHTLFEAKPMLDEARSRVKNKPIKSIPPIIATDHDPTAIDAARHNARTAGVEHLIDFRVCDFADSPVPALESDTPGVCVINPEYGLRLGEEHALEPTYSRIGDFMKQRLPGWTGHLLTANRALAGKVGLKSRSKTPLLNASIECRLLSYDLFAGSRDGGRPQREQPATEDGRA